MPPPSKLFPFVTPRMDPRPMRPDKPPDVKPTTSNPGQARAPLINQPTTLANKARHPADKRKAIPTAAEVRARFVSEHPAHVVQPQRPRPTSILLAMLGSATVEDAETGRRRDRPGYAQRNRAIRAELARRTQVNPPETAAPPSA